MTAPLTSIQGLSSGIQWQDLIDQIVQADTSRELTPVQNKVTADTNAQSAWTSYGTAMGALQTAVQPLATGSAFGSYAASVSPSPTSGATLLTASASSTATPGTYGVQVVSLAAAQQLTGNIVTDPTAAQNISGQFIVGGQVVTLAASDSLNAIRDKINALDTGTNTTHVSASVLMSGTANARLVLSSDVAGSAGIDLRDVRASNTDPSVLSQLGLSSGSVANVGTDGVTRSANFISTTAKISAMALGVSVFPAPATIKVNGQTVSIDLQNDTLTDIVNKINAAGPNTASIETVTNNGATSYRLDVSGAVSASGDAASQPILDLLGLTRIGTSVVQQQVTTSNVLQDSGSVTATSATALLGLKIAGQSGAQSGDTFTVTGTKADGTTPVNFTMTVDNTNTVNDLLTQLSTNFSSTSRHVTASIVGGEIQLTDDTGGDSGLSLSIAANNESGAGLSFGAANATVIGRQRQVSAGQDARIVVNGVTLTRSTNTISDAIAGVTLNLQQAEAGTTVQLGVTRDTSKVLSAVQSFVSAYNNAKSFVDTNTASGGALAFNSSVRASLSTVKNALLSNVDGLDANNPYNNMALVGVTFDKTGVLQVDTNAFTTALNSNPNALAGLFETNGIATGANLSYGASTPSTIAGTYNVNITHAATRPTVASTAANFTYAAGGSTDSMTIADGSSGHSGQISLVSGDTPDSVAAKLNALFFAQSMRLTAASSSGTLSITGLDYGSIPSFAISYASSGGNDVAAQTGIGTTASTTTIQNGTDVQGSFSQNGNTYVAAGIGQALTGASGTPVDGLVMLYSGTSDVLNGSVNFATGLAGSVSSIADSVARTGDGVAATQSSTLQDEIDSLNSRAAVIQERLDAERTSLTQQFTAMETALSQIQAQGTQLTNAINSLPSLQTSSK